jgi:hypothetical protein
MRIKDFFYAIYLGATLGIFADLHFWDWEYHLIIIPVICMVVLINENK